MYVMLEANKIVVCYKHGLSCHFKGVWDAKIDRNVHVFNSLKKYFTLWDIEKHANCMLLLWMMGRYNILFLIISATPRQFHTQ